VPRERLPDPQAQDEYYHADLIGLRVIDRAGQPRGTVIAIHNFGAGDVIEVRAQTGDKTELLPFDAATVPEINIAGGRIVVSSSPNAEEAGEAKPGRAKAPGGNRPLTRTATGSRRNRPTLSRKGRG